MGRLIDADILIAELKESDLHHCNNPREDSLLQRDRVIVRAQPTVKAIPLEKLEQIRAEIESRLQGVNITLEILVKDDALIPRMEAAKTTLEEVLDIFDKALKEVEQ